MENKLKDRIKTLEIEMIDGLKRNKSYLLDFNFKHNQRHFLDIMNMIKSKKQ